MSSGGDAGSELETMRGRNYPAIRQFTVFLENRVGQFLEVVRRFEGTKVRIVALSIADSADAPSSASSSAIPRKGGKSSNGPD